MSPCQGTRLAGRLINEPLDLPPTVSVGAIILRRSNLDGRRTVALVAPSPQRIRVDAIIRMVSLVRVDR